MGVMFIEQHKILAMRPKRVAWGAGYFVDQKEVGHLHAPLIITLLDNIYDRIEKRLMRPGTSNLIVTINNMAVGHSLVCIGNIIGAPYLTQWRLQ